MVLHSQALLYWQKDLCSAECRSSSRWIVSHLPLLPPWCLESYKWWWWWVVRNVHSKLLYWYLLRIASRFGQVLVCLAVSWPRRAWDKSNLIAEPRDVNDSYFSFNWDFSYFGDYWTWFTEFLTHYREYVRTYYLRYKRVEIRSSPSLRAMITQTTVPRPGRFDDDISSANQIPKFTI